MENTILLYFEKPFKYSAINFFVIGTSMYVHWLFAYDTRSLNIDSQTNCLIANRPNLLSLQKACCQDHFYSEITLTYIS